MTAPRHSRDTAATQPGKRGRPASQPGFPGQPRAKKLLSTNNVFSNRRTSRESDSRAHEEQDWFHGLLPRADINNLLEKDGFFLLRSSQVPGNEGFRPVLSIRWKGKIHHYILNENTDGGVTLEKHKFGSILEMVNVLMARRIPLTAEVGALLTTPVLKQDWELRHDQIELGKMLGEGAFGGVYRGVLSTKAGKMAVAVKVSKGNEKMSSKKMIEEVCKEARIMRRYQHPNIVNFYGVAVEKEPIMLVMELANTGALDTFLRTDKDVNLRDKLRFAFDAAKGLEYLHVNGCIHRDVAARNCLLHSGQVKISDFGLSKQLSDLAHKYKLKDLQTKLPIRWLAPEVLVSATYSCKSDIFSFGILLWEIFMDGAIPYPGMTLGEVSNKVRVGFRMSPPDRMPKFVRDTMILQCFPQNPEDRANMTEIRTNIQNVVEKRVTSNSCYQGNKSVYL